EGGSREG
ncbi:Hypothetical protein, putative, partial [Bodo saltans]